MLSRSVLRHAGWRPVQCPQYIAPRRAGWCSTTSALTGARCAPRRAWHGWLERRGCRSTPRRMGAAEAARQAAGIAAAKAPALCFAFARVLRSTSSEWRGRSAARRETRSAKPTLGEPCYGPATAHPPGLGLSCPQPDPNRLANWVHFLAPVTVLGSTRRSAPVSSLSAVRES